MKGPPFLVKQQSIPCGLPRRPYSCTKILMSSQHPLKGAPLAGEKCASLML